MNILRRWIPTEDESTQGWVVQSTKKKKRKETSKKSRPVVATRASSRVPRDGVPIASKAWLESGRKMIFKKVPLPTPLLSLMMPLINI
jgi:hypothetical protein